MATAKAKTQTFLARLPLFQEATPEDLDRIAAGTTEQRVPKGQLLFQRGDPCLGFHVVIYGQVKLAMVSPNGSEKVIAVHQGFVEVSPPDEQGNTRVTILSDVAEMAADIDVARARTAKERAEEALRADSEDPEAKAALVRAEVRLTAAEAA